MWKQHELWDGTYTIDDLLDAHELLDNQDDNERALRQWAADQKARE